MFKYSEFFKTLHNEQGPTGYLGRGTHYSVLRGVVWHDQFQKPLKRAAFLDLAIIWDEDHDIRVIEVLERLYFSNLLTPAIIIGERKGSFTIVTGEATLESRNEQWRQRYIENVNSVTQVGDDPWTTEVVAINQPTGIISDEGSKVCQYLQTIKMLWQLGTHEVKAFS